MGQKKTSASRRNFFKVGIGLAGGLITAPSLARVCEVATGEQPLGPFFPRAGTPEEEVREDQNPTTPIYLANDNDLTFVKGKTGVAQGQIVYIEGVVTDESCQPIPNATLIIWQASASGRYNHKGDAENHDFEHPVTGETIQRSLDPSFQYWGRASTDQQGKYQFKTIVPGFYPADLTNGWYRPPHIHFMVSATGFPQFVTQMYFRGDQIHENEWIQELNRRDFLLQSSSMSEEQREKLIVDFRSQRLGLTGTFDITLTK